MPTVLSKHQCDKQEEAGRGNSLSQPLLADAQHIAIDVDVPTSSSCSVLDEIRGLVTGSKPRHLAADQDSTLSEDGIDHDEESLLIDGAVVPEEYVSSSATATPRCGLKVWACVALASLMLLLCVLNIDTLLRSVTLFTEACRRLGWVSIPLVSMVIVAVIVSGMALNPLLVAVGILFVKMYGYTRGMAIGILASSIGVWVGFLLAFVLGRSLLRPFVEGRLSKSEWAQVMNKVVELEGNKIVFLAFCSPATPSFLVYALSLTSLSFRDFAIGAIGNIFPSAFVVYTAGATASAASVRTGGHASSGGSSFWTMCLLNFIILVAMIALAVHSTRRYQAAIASEKHRSSNTA